MTGQRLPDGFEPTADWYARIGVSALPPGAYFKDADGVWCAVSPNGRLGSLSNHAVTEHSDGTITVSPSILIHPVEPRTYEPDQRRRLVEQYGETCIAEWERGKPAYHGYLERGVWRSV